MKNKKGNIVVIVIITVIVAITAGVVGWMIAKRTQVPVSEVAIFEPVVPVVQPKITPTVQPIGNACEIGNKVYFEVKEMNIKFLVDKSIKDDLVYKYNSSNNSIYLSAKTLYAMNAGCSVDSGPLGAIGVVTGKPEPGTYYDATGRYNKQFDGFFVNYSGPQAPCAFDSAGQLDEKAQNYTFQLIGKIFFTSGIDCVEKIK